MSETKETNEQGNTVDLTVTVAVACNKGNDDQTRLLEELARKNKRMLEAPKPQRYFHCEYTIVPESEPTVTDVVSYGIAAKVYTETDSRVVKTWDDGPSTWVAWSQPHKFELSEGNVENIYNHTLDFKLWDSKDKVSAKARFDRPKAFRLPSTKDGAPGKGVAAVVAKQSRSWTNLQPRDSAPGVSMGPISPQQKREPETPPPATPLQMTRLRKSLGLLAGVDSVGQSTSKAASRDGGSRGRESVSAGRQEGFTKQMEGQKRTPAESSRVKAVSIPIKFELLFSGLKEVTSRLSDPSLNINDMFVSVSLSGSFLPEDLRRKLNPLVIHVKSVKDLPETPVPRNKLAFSCEPVFCSYKFLDNPIHVTTKRPHSGNVYFEDMHVILTGKMEPGRLFEYLHRKGLEVEIHDRDQKVPEDTKPPLIFGRDDEDKRIATISAISSKRTTQNAFRDRHRDLNRFGVAEVFLNELLHGRLHLNMSVAVRPSHVLAVTHDSVNSYIDLASVAAMNGTEPSRFPPILPGDYLQAGTTLKMKVSLSYPLTKDPTILSDSPLGAESCPFARVICYFHFENKELLQYLEGFMTEMNMKALKLDQFDRHVAEAALATYKLSYKQKESTDLDILTGFHVMDGEFHLFVLEGLREGSLLELYEELSLTRRRLGFVRLLYDTSLSFTSRLYADLDVNPCTIKLHQPLQKILEQPLLYVRDLVPRLCFECLTLVKGILEVTHLRDVCRNDLFPSFEMVLSMSREFGVPITRSDYELHHKKELAEREDDAVLEIPVEKSEAEECKPDEKEMVKEKRTKPQKPPNFVLRNIVSTQEAGRRKRPLPPKIYGVIEGTSHNYSTQALCSAELAKNVLRSVLYEKDPKSRYAYNNEYNSAMVPPADEDEHYRREDEAVKLGWKTSDGFVFPGVRSSLLCNVHPSRPDEARIDDLKLRWRENTLHNHKLKPTLNRNIWGWDARDRDMNLYSRPCGKMKTESVHLPGQKRQKEINDHQQQINEEWRSRVVVDDTIMRFHRVSCNTEQTNASNQVDKLGNILKDDPKKYSLRFRSTLDIPSLSVVTHSTAGARKRTRNAEIHSRQAGLQPGPYDGLSWKLDKNTIPIKDMEHDRYRTLKGSDFTTYLKERQNLAKKTIVPLTDRDRDHQLFRAIHPSAAAPKKKQSEEMEREKDSLIDKKSEYKDKFMEIPEPKKLEPILPRHQFLQPSQIPSFKDASLELVGGFSGFSSHKKESPQRECVSVE